MSQFGLLRLELDWVEKNSIFFQKWVELNLIYLINELNGFELIEGGLTYLIYRTYFYNFFNFFNYLLFLII